MNHRVISRWQAVMHLLAGLVPGLSATAQITFRITDHPNQAGVDTWKIRDDTSGRSITPLLGAPGGPHRWDFSYPMTADEAIRTTAIVVPGDGGHQGPFPEATYAERETVEATGCRSWSYLRLTAGSGRIQSGLYGACKTPQPAVVFDTPLTGTPDNLKFGDTWQQNTEWEDRIDADGTTFSVLYTYANTSRVDGYGTVVLPGGIGEVPALRVNEVTSYVITLVLFDIVLDSQHFRNYYWLVPGIGRAVQLSSPVGTSAPAEDFATSRSIFRVFESNRYPLRRQVDNLRIARGGNQILLSWDPDPEASQYEVQFSAGLGTGGSPWATLASPTAPSFSDTPGAAPSRFYRVFRMK